MILDAMIVPSALEVIVSLHLSPASLLNSRRPGITYEYILRSAADGGRRRKHLLFNGDNDRQSTAWTESWEEKEGTSPGVQLGFMQMVLSTWELWYSDRCVSIDGPAWTWTICA